jgi:hypothetical protein
VGVEGPKSAWGNAFIHASIHSFSAVRHANKPWAWHWHARLRCRMRVLCNNVPPSSESFFCPTTTYYTIPPHANRPHLSRVTWQDSTRRRRRTWVRCACHFCKRAPGHQNYTSVLKYCCFALGRPVHTKPPHCLSRPPHQPLWRHNVSPEHGRRASPRQLPQLVVRAPHFSVLDHCPSQVAPRAHHGRPGEQPTAISARRLPRCSAHHCGP